MKVWAEYWGAPGAKVRQVSAPARNGVALCHELGHFEDPADPCFCLYCGESVTGGTPCP